MSPVAIKVKVDASSLFTGIRRAASTGRAGIGRIIRNVAINYSQAASKESKPESGTSYKRLPKRARVRPFITIPEGYGVRKWWFMSEGRGGRATAMFTSFKDIPKGERRSRGIEKITKGVMFWDKKQNNWDWFGYKRGYTNEKRIPIPNAGYGKKGWMNAAGALGKGDKGGEGDAVYLAAGDKVSCTVHNKVKYASKVSTPGVLGRARDAAVKMLAKTYPEESGKLKQAWR